MSQALQKAIDEATRLIKDGKVDKGLAKLRPLKERIQADRDLNKLGDLLSRAGKVEDALYFYERMGENYARNGILAKAVAIYKKIVRLVPSHRQAKLQLGVLYLKQNIKGEAQRWLSEAAEEFEQHNELDNSLKVYETLAAAGLKNSQHHLKLAKARMRANQSDQALTGIKDFLGQLEAEDNVQIDESFFNEVFELFPNAIELKAGYVRWLRINGTIEQAASFLEELDGVDKNHPVIASESILVALAQGDDSRAMDQLCSGDQQIEDLSTLKEVAKLFIAKEHDNVLWERLDPMLEQWSRSGDRERSRNLLRALVEIDDVGYPPALERLADLLAEGQEPEAWRKVQSQLIEALKEAGKIEEAESAQAKLDNIEEVAEAVADDSSDPAQGETGHAALSRILVPENKASLEFAEGKLTQAEALEKYGLLDQALAMVREVTSKFSGYVPAQERLTRYLELKGAIGPARDAYVSLGLARLKAGDQFGAMEAIRQARAKAPLGLELRETLTKLGLVQEKQSSAQPVPAVQPETQQADADTPADPIPEPLPIEPSSALASDAASTDGTNGEATSVDGNESEVSIDFDIDIESDLDVQALDQEVSDSDPSNVKSEEDPSKNAESPQALTDGAEDKASESAEQVDSAEVPNEGEQKTEAPVAEPATESPGSMNDFLDELIPEVDDKPQAESPEKAADSVGGDRDDDLDAIAAALESSFDVGTTDPEAPSPKAESEQSLEEVFAAFKERVAEEVDEDDHRTHYDLGIAYKEMGLISEAIREFEVSLGDVSLRRDACTMIAMLYKEQSEADRAVQWYRRALQSEFDDTVAQNGLQYDLASLLAETGDTDEAIEIFKNLESTEPGFRDVRTRIVELEARR